MAVRCQHPYGPVTVFPDPPPWPVYNHRAVHCNAHPSLQASLNFCSECNNLLYPRADPQRSIMVYACRICDYEELAENKLVYRNDLLTVTK